MYRRLTIPDVLKDLGISEEQFESSCQDSRYGDFILTDAIRPLTILPITGYKFSYAIGTEADTEEVVPLMCAAASAEKVFRVFMECVDLSEDIVSLNAGFCDMDNVFHSYVREDMLLSELKPMLSYFRKMLTHDGFVTIAVVSNDDYGISLDDHKIIRIYGETVFEQYEDVMNRHDIFENRSMQFIDDGEHLHSSAVGELERLDEFLGATGLEKERRE